MAKVLGVPETIARMQSVRLLGYGQAEGGAIGQAAAKAACLASGATWSDTLGNCIAKMRPIVTQTEKQAAPTLCVQAGRIWNTQDNTCLPAEPKASSLAGPLLIAGLAAVVGWFWVRRKRT